MAGMKSAIVMSPGINFATGFVNLDMSFTGGTEARDQRPWLIPGNFNNLRLNLGGTLTGGNTLSAVLRKNGLDTLMALTFTAGGAITQSYPSNISIADGDLLSWRLTRTGADAVNFNGSLEFEPTSGTDSCYGCNFFDGSAATPLFFPFMGPFNLGSSTAAVCTGIVSTPGTFTKKSVNIEGGAGSNHVWTTYKSTDDGVTFVAQNGSGGTPDTRTIYGTPSTFSFHVNAGDLIYERYDRLSGGAINVYGGVTMKFTPDNNARFMLTGLSRNVLNNATTTYAVYVSGTSAFGGTPFAIAAPMSDTTCRKFYGCMLAPPGAARQYQFDFTKDGSTSPVAGSPTIIISGAVDRHGSDIANTLLLTDLHAFTIRSVPTGSPSPTNFAWGLEAQISADSPVVRPFGFNVGAKRM